MSTTQEVFDLLHKKKALFEQYEDCTNALSHCDFDIIEDYITKRAQLAIEIDKIDDTIKKHCASYDEKGTMADAVANRCEYGTLSVELKEVFAKAQEIFAIINRISQQETALMHRFKTQRTELEEKIKASKNTPKIQRYLNGLATKPESGAYLGQKYNKV